MKDYYEIFQNNKILNLPRVLRTLRFVTNKYDLPNNIEAREECEKLYSEVVTEITKIFVNQKDLEDSELKKAVSNFVSYLSEYENEVYVAGNTSFGDVLSYMGEDSEILTEEDHSKEILEDDYSEFFREEESEENPLNWDTYILTQNKTVQDLWTVKSFLESLSGKSLKELNEQFSFKPVEQILKGYSWDLITMDELPYPERNLLWEKYFETLVNLPRETKQQISTLESLIEKVSSYPDFFNRDAGIPHLEILLSNLKRYYKRSLENLENLERDDSESLNSLLRAYFTKNYTLVEDLMVDIGINEEQLEIITSLVQVRHEILYYFSQALREHTEDPLEEKLKQRMINVLLAY